MTKNLKSTFNPPAAGTCAFCTGRQLIQIIDFGDVALAGGFLEKNQIADEKKYPLALVFCKECYAVQVRDHINPSVLFSTDYYFSSAIKTLRDHFADYAANVVSRFLPNPKNGKVLEFGSNDGVLLHPLAEQGVGRVIGVDPATNIVKSINNDQLVLINDFFNVDSAQAIVKRYGKLDMVMANNVFAHITDINNTTRAVSDVLSADGVFIFEVHYLGKIIQELQYDFIYHEHVYYYSLIALQNHLERHGMVIFDIKHIPIHGGSIRYYASKKDSKYAKKIHPAVNDLREQELAAGYDKSDTYQQFAAQVTDKKNQLMKLISEIKSDGKKIVGYGASGRANTIIQYCGIDSRHIEFMIDDAPAKQGLYTPGSHLEIRNSEVLNSESPDYVLLFAWAFCSEIIKRSQEYLSTGGQFIVPLPDVKVIGR